MASARGITLRRYEIAHANHYHLRGFRLKVDVEAVEGGMDRHVFVFRRHPPNPYSGEVIDEFVTVASFVDLSDYPVGQPSPDTNLPFFRLDAVELDVRSTQELEEIWQLLQAEVRTLVAALNRAERLTLVESVTCGEAATAESASSESLS